MITFSKEYKVRDEGEKKAGKFYLAAAIICAVAVAAAFIVFAIVGRTNAYQNMTIPNFQAALDSGNYEEALSIYRSVQDEVLSASPEDAGKFTTQTQMLAEMEAIVAEKTDTLCNRILTERYIPIQSDVEFLDSMEELTSSVVYKWLNELCVSFLLGETEKPDVMFVFDQLEPIGNLAATSGPLLRELDNIETATGEVQTAETAFAKGDYISAVKGYQGVSEGYDGFVYDYSVTRIEEIKDIMYEPMINECEHMLETFKFYSAEELLSDLAVIFPDDERIKSDLLTATGNTTETYEYYGQIEVLCVRSLIADPETAFAEGYASNESGLYLTCEEFETMLEQLYAGGYCLVNPENLIDMSDSTYLLERNLKVPVGKKPLIIVVENLTYSATAYGYGTCRQLVLNDSGQVCGQYVTINENGDEEIVISRTAECIGILDQFVEENPDFTYDGAKGIISVSGYESVFGYVVSEDEIDDRNAALATQNMPSIEPTADEILANQETVTKIADALKDEGWQFASCTYGYLPNARSCTMEEIQADTEKWLDQICPLLGEVHMIVYPGGNYIYGTDDEAVYLKNLGFRIFFGIGSKPYYTYGDNYLYFDRSIISANTLVTYDYSRILDAEAILDPARGST